MPFISRLLSFYSPRTSLILISLHLYGLFAFMTVLFETSSWLFSLSFSYLWLFSLLAVLSYSFSHFWLFSLMVVLTYGCSHLWLFSLMAVLSYGCSHLWLFSLIAVLTYNCSNLWLFYLMTVLTYGCSILCLLLFPAKWTPVAEHGSPAGQVWRVYRGRRTQRPGGSRLPGQGGTRHRRLRTTTYCR